MFDFPSLLEALLKNVIYKYDSSSSTEIYNMKNQHLSINIRLKSPGCGHWTHNLPTRVNNIQ